MNGNGVAMLRAAGVRVDGPILEGAAKQLIAPFLAAVHLRRPYVTLKWAESRNGRVAGPMGKRVKITNAGCEPAELTIAAAAGRSSSSRRATAGSRPGRGTSSLTSRCCASGISSTRPTCASWPGPSPT